MSKPGVVPKRPKYKEEEEIREKMRVLEKEQSEIQGYLSLIYEGFESEGRHSMYGGSVSAY